MQCGIYKIYWSNNPSGKPYFGSTIRPFSTREKEHRKLLKKGTHPNKCMQRYANKYGNDNIVFQHVHSFNLGEISLLELRELEQSILNSYSDGFHKKLANGTRNAYGADESHTRNLKATYGRKISIEGVQYPSVGEAIRTLNMPDSKIRYRLNSQSTKWQHWKFVSEPLKSHRKTNSDSKSVTIDGITYSSIYEASRLTGKSTYYIRMHY